MILNKAIETMNQSEKETLQSQKLRKLIERAYEKSPFYQERMDTLGLTPTDIKRIQDIHQLPLTTAMDLSNHYPFGFLTMPLSGVARFERSPDSLITSGFTAQDLIWQQELIARSLVACYITTTSVLLHLPEVVASISARSLQQSAEMLGVTVIADQTDDTKSQLNRIVDFGITTLFSTPTRLLAFAKFLSQEGIKTQDLPLMNLLCEGQYISAALGNELTEKFQLPVYTLYGHPHIMSLGIAGECYQQHGLHIHDDHFYLEIINLRTGAVLDDQQPGELVITTLSREATPLIRYRTGETALLTREICTCGRTSPRITFLR